ncbi:MAG: box helicase, partial [Glaciihabitans sp.]|nr:box helicase [Glaciihabitans sp.]
RRRPGRTGRRGAATAATTATAATAGALRLRRGHRSRLDVRRGRTGQRGDLPGAGLDRRHLGLDAGLAGQQSHLAGLVGGGDGDHDAAGAGPSRTARAVQVGLVLGRRVDVHDERQVVDEANSPVAAMTHHVFEVEGVEAKRLLVEKLASGSGRRILFMRTKHHAKKLARQLTDSGIPAVDLHGNLSQVQRDRNLAAFSAGDVRVLVATDVAARGVHVDDIELVIHVDPPSEHKAYLHRSGRTARAGAEGDVVTLVLPEQRKDTAALLRKAAISVEPQRVSAASDAVAALVGNVAAYVKPSPRAAEPVRGQSQGGRSQGANAQRKRANRDGGFGGGSAGRDSQPRRDRAGRPAASGSGRPASSGSGRTAQAGSASGRPVSAHGERPAQQRSTEQAAPARKRGGNGRAQSAGGPIRVGQVVRPNRTSR